MTSIREIEIERDAPDLVELVHEINPTSVMNLASYVHRETSVPARADSRTWVAVADGRAVGRIECYRNFFTEGSTNAFLNVAVREAYRRGGIGRDLYDVGVAYAGTLGVDELLADFHENDAGVAFASRLGFREVRAETESVLDPREVRDKPPPDIDLRPIGTVDPRLVYAVDLEATLDMPQHEVIDPIPYEEWVEFVLGRPGFTAEGSFAAMADGVAAAVSFLVADLASGRANSMFTGTLRAYRGRGLARAVKLASIHWAAEHGITTMATTNDETNTGMLAINRRLGYRPAGRRVEYLRDLS